MADYRTVKTAMWAQDEWFMELPLDGKLLWLYLFTNAHASVAGIYKLPIRTICNETGIDLERVEVLLQVFAQQGKAKHADGVLWVVKMREHQATTSPLVEKRIAKDVALLSDTPLKREYLKKYSTDRVSVGYLESCVETETETDPETETEERGTRTPAPIDPLPEQSPEYREALRKLDAQWPGAVTGSVQLKLTRIWGQVINGKAAWLDDAIMESVARDAHTPDYAIQVLATALRSNKRPGQVTTTAKRPQGRNLDELLGITNGNT